MKSIDKIIAVAGYVQLVFYIFMLQTWIFDAVFPLSNIRVFLWHQIHININYSMLFRVNKL